MKKNLASAALLATMALGLAVSASAAGGTITPYTNNTNIPMAFQVSSSYQYTKTAAKEDTSPVYVYYSTGTYSAIRVTAYGLMTQDNKDRVTYTELSDRSTVSFVYVPINQHTKVHTGIYEGGKKYAVLGIRSMSYSTTDYIAGVWSPDSVGYANYTSATNTL
jgi:hypothetical protein